MNKWLLRSLYVAPVLLTAGLATADYTATQGAGTTVFAFVCSATKVCPASVLINSANTEIATASNPVRTDPTGTTTQPVTNTNLGTTADAVCGTATGTCSLIALTKFNNTATSNPIPAGTNAIGTVTAVQATGTNLHVVCDSGCSGSGGTSSNFGATFPAAGTALGAKNGANMVNLNADASGNLLVSGLGLAIGSTTSGQTGSLVFAATTTAPPTNTTAQSNPLSATVGGQLRTVGMSYPDGAVPITNSATGTTAATTATLAASATLKTYICGYSIRANATAAVTGNATVTGSVSGTMNFTQWTAPAASGLGISEQVFMPCVPSSAINTAIAVVSAAPGTGGVVSTTAWGYQAP